MPPSVIVVLGDIMNDVIVKPDGPLNRGSDRRAVIRVTPGGSGANQAVWLAWFGAEVRFIAKVGKDDLARQEMGLRRRGVDPRLVCDEERSTGILVTLVDPDGQRSFLTDRGANESLDPSDLAEDLLEGASIVHVSGYAFFAEKPRAAAIELMKRARKRGLTITVDPCSTAFLEEVGVANFLRWTADATFCFPNEDEAEVLAGTDDKELQRRILAETYQFTVIKRGGRGAEIVGQDGALISILAAPPRQTVDSSGAGDAFLAGFLAAHSMQVGLVECLQQGIAGGSTAVCSIGAQPDVAVIGDRYGRSDLR